MTKLIKSILKNDLGDFKIQIRLLEKEGVETPDGRGLTALQVAGREGQFEMTARLIQAGALVNPPLARLSEAEVDSFYYQEVNKSPLDYALERGHIQTAILLEFCDSSMQEMSQNLNRFYPLYLPAILTSLVLLSHSDSLHECVERFITRALTLSDDLLATLRTQATDLMPLAAKLNNTKILHQLLRLGAKEYQALLKNKISNNPIPLTRFQEKIYRIAAKGNSNSLDLLCSEEEENVFWVIDYAYEIKDFVALSEILKVNLNFSKIVNLAFENKKLPLAALLILTTRALDDNLYLLTNSSLKKYILDFSSLEGTLQNIYRRQDIFAFNKLRKLWLETNEEKPAELEAKLLKPLLLNSQDEANCGLSDLLKAAQEKNYSGFKELLASKKLSINIAYLLKMYELKNFQPAIKYSAPIPAQIIWKIINNDFLYGDEKSLSSLEATSQELKSITRQFRNPKLREIMAKEKKIKELEGYVTELEEKKNNLGFNDTDGPSWGISASIFSILSISFGIKFDFVSKEIDEVFERLGPNRNLITNSWDPDCGYVGRLTPYYEICQELEVPGRWAYASSWITGISAAIAFFSLFAVWAQWHVSRNKPEVLPSRCDYYTSNERKEFVKQLIAEYNFPTHSLKYPDAIAALQQIIKSLNQEIRDINLIMPHIHRLFNNPQQQIVEIKEENSPIELVSNDEGTEMNSNLLRPSY